jgi:hypothetical protein
MTAMNPFLVQDHSRIRSDTTAADPGTPVWETTIDQAAALDWPTDTTFRIRFVVSNTGDAVANSPYQIYVSKNSAAYAAVTTTSSNVQSADASSSADALALTTGNFQLTAGTGTATNGEYDETGETNANLGNGDYFELEFGLTIVDADVSPGNTLDFQVYYNGAAMDSYSHTPRVTVEAQGVTRDPPAGALVLGGVAARLDLGIQPPVGALALSGSAPSVVIATNLEVPSAALSLGHGAVNTVTFDGTNDWLNGNASVTDSKVGLVSFWCQINDADATSVNIIRTGGFPVSFPQFHVFRNSSNKIQINGLFDSSTIVLTLTSTSDWTSADGIFHVVASWDLANTLGHLYINGSDDLAGGSILTDSTINYNRSLQFGIAAAPSDGSGKAQIDLGDVWFSDSTYSDITVASNLAKFIRADGTPAYLGTDGSLPTGSSPDVFLTNPTATWHTNAGAGTGLTENGAITDGPLLLYGCMARPSFRPLTRVISQPRPPPI